MSTHQLVPIRPMRTLRSTASRPLLNPSALFRSGADLGSVIWKLPERTSRTEQGLSIHRQPTSMPSVAKSEPEWKVDR